MGNFPPCIPPCGPQYGNWPECRMDPLMNIGPFVITLPDGEYIVTWKPLRKSKIAKLHKKMIRLQVKGKRKKARKVLRRINLMNVQGRFNFQKKD